MSLFAVYIELDIEGYIKDTVQQVRATLPSEAEHLAMQQEAHGSGITKLGKWYRCNATGFLMQATRTLEVNPEDIATLEKYL